MGRFSHNEIPLWVLKLALLLAAAIWGLGTVVIKSTVDEFSPVWLVGVRFLGAGLILGLLAFPKITRNLGAAPAAHLHHGAILGVLVFGSYWCNSTGLTDTTASNSSFLTTLYVVIIPFLGWVILHKRPTSFNIVAALMCVAGVACVAYGGASGFSLRFGDVITMGSAVFLSLHVLYTAKYAPGYSMTTLTVVQFVVAGALGLLTGALTEPVPDFAHLSPDTWMNIAYLTVFASCAALGLQNAAVARVDPAQASLFLATECLFGGLLSVLLLGEAIAPSSGIGFALIFAGIVVSEYLPLRAEKRQAALAAANAEARAAVETGAGAESTTGTVTAVVSIAATATEITALDMEEADAFLR